MPPRSSNLYAIYRVDHNPSRTHSWLVTIQRRGRIYNRHFSDTVHGGKRQALKAATAYRDRLNSKLRPLTRQELCAIRKKNNRSGVSGVSRVDVMEKGRSGQLFPRVYWDVQWPTGNGKARHKKFSVKKYGEERAFQLACQTRRMALRSLQGMYLRAQPSLSRRDQRSCPFSDNQFIETPHVISSRHL
jgi:hypothetical protein